MKSCVDKTILLESGRFSITLVLNIRNKSKEIFVHLWDESTWIFQMVTRSLGGEEVALCLRGVRQDLFAARGRNP